LKVLGADVTLITDKRTVICYLHLKRHKGKLIRCQCQCRSHESTTVHNFLLHTVPDTKNIYWNQKFDNRDFGEKCISLYSQRTLSAEVL